MKPTPTVSAQNADIPAAIASADAFLSHATQFWAMVQKDPKNAGEIASKNIGELVVSATSLSLAIELYLKALLLVLGQPTPKVHDLPVLLGATPAKARQDIEAEYSRLRAAEDPDGSSGVSLHVVRKGGIVPSFGPATATLGMSLDSVLRRNATAFQTWRYLFANGPTLNESPLRFEYLRLWFAARSARHALTTHYARYKAKTAP